LNVTLLAIQHKKEQRNLKKRQVPIPTPPPVKKEGRGCCGTNACNMF